VYGKWTESMSAFNEETGQEILIWKANPLPDLNDHMYFFTHFGINLNYLPDSLRN